MSEWRTIDSAPKDSAETEVLTFTPPENHRMGVICGIHVAFWSHDFQEWRQSDLEWGVSPTHWMPLPEPPK